MKRNHSVSEERVEKLFSKELISSMHNQEELLNKMVTEIKQLTLASHVELYLYDDWKDDFELVKIASNDEKLFRRYLISDGILKKEENKRYHSEFNIYNGQETFRHQYDYPAFLVALNDNDSKVGYMLISFEAAFDDNDNFYCFLEKIASEINALLNGLDDYSQTMEQASKYELMYRVTQKFHSTMNTNDVLTEIVDAIKYIYPDFSCNLFLSRDYQSDKKLPVKELIYNEEFADKLSVKAFSTGEIKIEVDKNKSRLFAPLHGKQGTYGVLQITAYDISKFPESDVEFIRLLANTAGNALENAQLYQQSNQLIADLQLINEISHKLNSNLRLNETTLFMKQQLKESFHAEEIGFVLLNEEVRKYQILQESTAFFDSADAKIFIDEMVEILKEEQDAIFIGDFTAKYPNRSFGLKAVMVMPMIQSDQLKGAIIILHPKPYFFSFENFKLIKSIVHHSTLAFVNSMLREQLENLVITDYLTKLYSRKYLDEKCKQHLETDTKGIFLLLDIDDFKQVNDTYGHDVGDELIIQVANIIMDEIKNVGFSARWGGEELAVYLPECNLKKGMEVASTLVKVIEISSHPKITVSIGIACWDQNNPENMNNIFDRADRSLYEAKRLGKNGVAKI
ncbi:sensor domain-containing diguanylate cyclase [Paraliobacillus sediminis]|uniref:sensor domain-containing diguanylate cyclase n=1 Tax=Paraliobacillus sediminis TaxID=1885916 RepID=UPI001F07C7F3|nr:sensor domain-containing diguanylate cyclase [Paraliobacillus sediminis]